MCRWGAWHGAMAPRDVWVADTQRRVERRVGGAGVWFFYCRLTQLSTCRHHPFTAGLGYCELGMGSHSLAQGLPNSPPRPGATLGTPPHLPHTSTRFCAQPFPPRASAPTFSARHRTTRKQIPRPFPPSTPPRPDRPRKRPPHAYTLSTFQLIAPAPRMQVEGGTASGRSWGRRCGPRTHQTRLTANKALPQQRGGHTRRCLAAHRAAP